MRYLVLLGLILWSGASHAFEFEAEVTFPANPSSATLRIISTTDTEVFAPVIDGFRAANPGVTVIYTVASSGEVQSAVTEAGAVFDIAISSAMDLQTKLANDGYARAYVSDATELVPAWGLWRDSVFGFTQEPAAIVLSRAAFADLPVPTTRSDLIDVLRDNPGRFTGRIGTYDVRQSGLGYLFATQDSRTSDTYWRLTELMGRLKVRLYCCSSDMIDDVSRGDIAVAYNVLGSYAAARTDLADDILIVAPEDYSTVLSRSAVLLKGAGDPDVGARFLDYLLTVAWGTPGAAPLLAAVGGQPVDDPPNIRRIPFGPGLMVFLDRLKRRQFIAEWRNAILQ
jgi:iron(III) transport system substrate-binding protein